MNEKIIAEKVDSIFLTHKGEKIPIQAVMALSLMALEVAPKDVDNTMKKIQDYLYANSGEFGKYALYVKKNEDE